MWPSSDSWRAFAPSQTCGLKKTIAQGVDMGRPSRLEARAEKSAGTFTATFIGGTCVPMMRGTLEIG